MTDVEDDTSRSARDQHRSKRLSLPLRRLRSRSVDDSSNVVDLSASSASDTGVREGGQMASIIRLLRIPIHIKRRRG